ncbi:hypothetical protein EZS27_006294 [termite gut metagenome]|uniref:Lipoprotein n=1 Tax=termite gut metagenome TaxID=433724 RepID=A0A5J4SL83_9ZZZZ
MKTTQTISLLIILLATLFSSCTTSKTMQHKMRSLRSDLYYELTTPEYIGEITDSVYLNFIDYSNMDYYTTVKKRGTMIIPLILFNYSKEKFDVVLGEGSLAQTYREFLTDALLTECNSSTSLHLDNTANITPDSAYVLNVKILHNRTTSAMKLGSRMVFLYFGQGTDFIFNFPNHTIMPAIADLEFHVYLMQGKNCLFEKTYSTYQEWKYLGRIAEDPANVNEACLDNMTECLSIATKSIVENISSELHLWMSGRKTNLSSHHPNAIQQNMPSCEEQ